MNEPVRFVRYGGERKAWNEFVRRSKNGTFLFQREYMEYHADRFADHSLLAYVGSRLRAVLPANLEADVLVSHGGLTYGGIVCTPDMSTPLMLRIFSGLREWLLEAGIRRVVYKPVPHIYHRAPAEEDLYCLFRQNARLVRRDVSSTIDRRCRVAYSKGRKWSLKKARELGLKVARSSDFAGFMRLEEENLESRHNARPTHTGEEMKLLADRFPDNISLYIACREQTMLAGAIVYVTPQVSHVQYIATSEEGRARGALDLVLDQLICEEHADRRYFDLGISTEQSGRYLNEGLIQNKESYGASATVYDTYEWVLA